MKFNDIENADRIDTFYYKKDYSNWVSPSSGEIFVQDSDLEFLKNENTEKRNYKELANFFNKESEKMKNK